MNHQFHAAAIFFYFSLIVYLLFHSAFWTFFHYDDEAINQLVDRSNEGIEQKESWANDYLSSFKVASYVTTQRDDEEDQETEITEEEAENTDPGYWENLLGGLIGPDARSFGKGKRVRKQVKKYLILQFF